MVVTARSERSQIAIGDGVGQARIHRAHCLGEFFRIEPDAGALQSGGGRVGLKFFRRRHVGQRGGKFPVMAQGVGALQIEIRIAGFMFQLPRDRLNALMQIAVCLR